MTHLTEGLNEAQRQAVESDHPRLLVIAGAGSGKTRVLTARVARLLDDGVDPNQILCVTFTRDAAAEMRERIETLVRGSMPTIRTLHSWAMRVLRHRPEPFNRDKDFTVFDDVDRQDIIRACARDLGHKKWDRSKIPTLWRDEEVQELYESRKLQSNAFDYDDLQACALQLLEADEWARQHWVGRYKHVLIDEYQDTNLVQVALVNGLLPANLFVVGDPRQSIYGFRGAVPQTIVDLATDHDFELIQLTTNYRSRPAIVEAANSVIGDAWKPMDSARSMARTTQETDEVDGSVNTVHTRLSDSDVVKAYHVGNEPEAVARIVRDIVNDSDYRFGDIAVLGRHWSPLHETYRALKSYGIPSYYAGNETDPWSHEDGRALGRALQLSMNLQNDNLTALLAEWGHIHGSRFTRLGHHRAAAIRQREPLAITLADIDDVWKRVCDALVMGPHDLQSLATEIVEAFGIPEQYRRFELSTRLAVLKTCIEQLADFNGLEDFCEWWTDRTVQERLREEEAQNSVTLVTVHGSKGLEYPVVIALDCRLGVYPTTRRTATAEDIEEDRRVFYVLITRARDQLIFSVPAVYRAPWRKYPDQAEPSPFLTPNVCPTLEELHDPTAQEG